MLCLHRAVFDAGAAFDADARYVGFVIRVNGPDGTKADAEAAMNAVAAGFGNNLVDGNRVAVFVFGPVIRLVRLFSRNGYGPWLSFGEVVSFS